MKCYCLVAQSAMWSSCDCINLSDLISCSHEWERMRKGRKRRRERSDNLNLDEDFKRTQQSKQRRKQLRHVCCSSEALKSQFLSLVCFLRRREQRLYDMQKCIFGLSSKSKWSRDHCVAPPMASKATRRPQRITMTRSYTNTDSERVSIISVVL